MTTRPSTLRKPIKISLHYHKSNGKIVYRHKKGDKVDEYVTDLTWHKEPSNAKEREDNKNTVRLLEETLQDKLHDLRRGKYHLQAKEVKGRNVLDDLKEYAESKDQNFAKRTLGQHITIIGHLKTFTQSSVISYDDLTEDFCREYLSYLKSDGVGRMGKSLAPSSVENYFNKFKVFLSWALDKGYLMVYPADKVKVKKAKSKSKESLSAAELQMLIHTSCASPILRRWFLFSCFSGQAFAECLEMEWRDIYEAEGVTRIKGTRIKTNSDYDPSVQFEQIKYLLNLFIVPTIIDIFLTGFVKLVLISTLLRIVAETPLREITGRMEIKIY